MTAHAMAGDREKSLAAGMNDYVAKPIDSKQLFSALERWILLKADQKSDQTIETENLKMADKPPSSDILSQPRAIAAENDLPDSLQGFDLAAGLKRLQGNDRLYRKLLVNFAVRYTAAGEEIQKALAEGQMEQVHSLIHNLKGLAGNLSATRLHAAASQMDAAVKKVISGREWQPDSMDSMFAEVQESLAQALKSCNILKQSAPAAITESPRESIPSMPPELAEETAQRLREAAEMGNVNELKAIAEALQTRCDDFAGLGEIIRQMAEDFDFDSLVQLAGEISDTQQR